MTLQLPPWQDALPCETALLPHWQPELKQSPAWSGLITQSGSTLSITNTQKSSFEGDRNPRCTRGKKTLASPTIIVNPSVSRLKVAPQSEKHRQL